MSQHNSTRNLLINHYKKHPKMEIKDIFKFLYQSYFGCEHLVTSISDIIERINAELDDCQINEDDDIEILDGGYARVPLAYLHRGLKKETFAKLFFMSAQKEPEAKSRLENGFEEVKELIKPTDRRERCPQRSVRRQAASAVKAGLRPMERRGRRSLREETDGSGDGIEVIPLGKGMAAAKPLQGHPAALPYAVFLHRLEGILRAGGTISAAGRKMGGNAAAVKLDGGQHESLHCPSSRRIPLFLARPR